MFSDQSDLSEFITEEKPSNPEIIKLERLFENANQKLTDQHLKFLQAICNTYTTSNLIKAELEYNKVISDWSNLIENEKIKISAIDEKARQLVAKKSYDEARAMCNINNQRSSLVQKYEKLLLTTIHTHETVNTSFGYVKPVKEEKNETSPVKRNSYASLIYSYYCSLWRQPTTATSVKPVTTKAPTILSPKHS